MAKKNTKTILTEDAFNANGNSKVDSEILNEVVSENVNDEDVSEVVEQVVVENKEDEFKTVTKTPSIKHYFKSYSDEDEYNI